MQKIIKNTFLVFLMLLFFSFFSVPMAKAQKPVASGAKPQKTISYQITNKGSKSISFSQRNTKDNNVGDVVYKLDKGKKQLNEGKIGNKIVIECNGKKQIFILRETKDNDFTVNCN